MPESVFLRGGQSSIIHQATVTLTDAQIKALPDTPINLISSIGSEQVALILNGYVQASFVAPYTNVDASAFLYFYRGAAVSASAAPIVFDGNMNVAGATRFVIAAPFGVSGTDVLSPDASVEDGGKLLTLHIGSFSGPLTGGNAANTIKISFIYLVLHLSTGQFE